MSNNCSDQPHPFLQCLFCSTLPVGRLSFTCDQLVENIISATEQITSRIASDSIQSVHVKTPDSVALPILNCMPPGPSMIDVTAQPSVTSKRSRPEDDEQASGVTEAEETLPVKKKVKRTKLATKLSTKRVRGSVVVKKTPIRRRKKR